MDIQELQKMVVQFRDERDWKQFHNPKDLALSLVLESSEVLEHFQWKNGDEIEKYISTEKEAISHELADVLYWVLLMSNDLDIDISKAFIEKIKLSGEKYPIDKAKGKSEKYNKLP
ncbi:nucleotide pyrophosphohydrolase [Candidatus Gracilibacteria bacterium]|nr:nucleotide pyrophosphohydrolase [Candidatus Gracilibacteria bacterium]